MVKKIELPKSEFPTCIGGIPFQDFDQAFEGGPYFNIDLKLTMKGCHKCPHIDLCLKLQKLSLLKRLGEGNST